MTKARTRLTPEIQKTICAFIRTGAYPHIAAEAAGVPKEDFEHWIKIATESKKPPKKYRGFAAAVEAATAHARLSAESRVLDKDPKTWLTQGPGKDRPGRPGWSGVVKPLIEVDNRPANLLTDPAAGALLTLLFDVLAPFPEARRVVADALQGASLSVSSP